MAKKTEILTEAEITKYIENNNLEFRDKLQLNMNNKLDDIHNTIGGNQANIGTLSKSVDAVVKAQLDCPARVMVETGKNVLKAGKAVPVVIGFVIAIITIATLVITKVVNF